MMSVILNVMDTAVFVEFLDTAILVFLMWLGWFLCSVFFRFVRERHCQQHFRAKLTNADADMSEIRTATSASCPDSTIEDLHSPVLDDVQKVRWLLESHGVFGASPGAWASAAGSDLGAASEISVDKDREYEGAESDVDWEPLQDSGGASHVVADATSKLGMLCDHDALFSGPNASSSIKSHPLHAGQGTLAIDGSTFETCSADEAALEEGPLEEFVPCGPAARTLFEQYSLFGAEPGTWSKDSDCSTSYSSKSESVMATQDIASDPDSEVEVDSDVWQDMCET
jgi:hypothetical protein